MRGQKALDNQHMGFTIECQFEPGGIQVNNLNDAILHPGEVYAHDMVLSFKKR
jgi:galactose mutarotase-like enzyme